MFSSNNVIENLSHIDVESGNINEKRMSGRERANTEMNSEPKPKGRLRSLSASVGRWFGVVDDEEYADIQAQHHLILAQEEAEPKITERISRASAVLTKLNSTDLDDLHDRFHEAQKNDEHRGRRRSSVAIIDRLELAAQAFNSKSEVPDEIIEESRRRSSTLSDNDSRRRSSSGVGTGRRASHSSRSSSVSGHRKSSISRFTKGSTLDIARIMSKASIKGGSKVNMTILEEEEEEGQSDYSSDSVSGSSYTSSSDSAVETGKNRVPIDTAALAALNSLEESSMLTSDREPILLNAEEEQNAIMQQQGIELEVFNMRSSNKLGDRISGDEHHSQRMQYSAEDWFGYESQTPPTYEIGFDEIGITELPSRGSQRRSSLNRRKRMNYQKTQKISEAHDRLKTLDPKVKQQLAQQNVYVPHFIRWMTFVQILTMCVVLIMGPIAPFGFGTKIVEEDVLRVDGTKHTMKLSVPENFWVGPPSRTLIQLGAKFTPCMREDIELVKWQESENEREAQGLGCCEIDDILGCKAVLESGCPYLAKFHELKSCSDIPGCKNIRTRPCCYGMYGQCQIIGENYCQFLRGTYHEDKQTCRETNCLEHVCGFRGFEDKPNQWYRFILPIFLHVGILHLLFNLLFQFSVGSQIERASGPIRLGIIYFLSGIGGNIVSGIFTPYQAQVGASGSLYGLLGVMIVEIFQSWQLLRRPYYETIKVVLVIIFSLCIGLLPYVDNFAHIGGFIIGVMSSIVFLPYVVFGKYDKARKICLLVVTGPLLIVTLFGGFVVFYKQQDTDFCPWCRYLNCVPFTSTFCSANGQQLPIA